MFHFISSAQFSDRNRLGDIEACLKARPSKPCPLGIKGNPSKSNIAAANPKRDWRIHAELARLLIHKARALYSHDSPFSPDLDGTWARS